MRILSIGTYGRRCGVVSCYVDRREARNDLFMDIMRTKKVRKRVFLKCNIRTYGIGKGRNLWEEICSMRKEC